MTLDLLLKIRNKTLDQYKEEEVKPTALNRLERSLVMDALTKDFAIKVENNTLEAEVSMVVNDLIMSGEFQELQKSMGQKKFAETVTMEAANRSLENAIRAKLLEIADPSAVTKPIDAETAETEPEPAPEAEPEAAPKKKATRSKKADKTEEL